MDLIVVAYALYLLLSIPLTVLVARTLSKHGRTFLTEVFADSPGLANAVNQLLVVGFYLVSLGFVALFLTSSTLVLTTRGVFELLSVKIGTVALVLGVMHLLNVLVFNGIRRRHLAPPAPAPVPLPYPGMPQAPPFPAP
ncbi:hypothetical protein AMES_2691 [Amycolatopsis mediterranei S699]|uniref:Uncharacterized protein n=2 Tax=Amycolatopsis mediterranei TaxID=33910 RepID=A0A0H3D0S1_AMYMU|nr:hypothetical protein [Amycolatopsis mediterranei]ADJ44514.1 conserved hypothetical protein [Amycolatopsis mediterranei U32]AEK41253.1 hypothetical protein RAM_13825 [Amycolatopsis mediterranei S699]AFO76227.1 hypothetical protein AMES_2691 [Amycolatopsis mediterranei S699]AGT83356.1 hypothetical protein B737_2692 [Amycolatopsis mediterranei RB]KDO07128.1 membrane protein [Amycolatopsis mediterranei]